MKGFYIEIISGQVIRFNYYLQDAPITCNAFNSYLPFSERIMHARVSGQEIWTDKGPILDIIQENSSIYTRPGEVVLGPMRPSRNKAAGYIGIYYGDGQGLDGCNIFASVYNDDRELLQLLGEQVWNHGSLELLFNKID